MPAGKGVVTPEGVRVAVLSAKVGPVPLIDAGKKRETKASYLMVRVRVKNESETKKVDYKTWMASLATKLSDEHNNSYKRAPVAEQEPAGVLVEGQVVEKSILPGEVTEDLLTFEAPIDRATELTLELPAQNVGGDGVLRFSLPKDF